MPLDGVKSYNSAHLQATLKKDSKLMCFSQYLNTGESSKAMFIDKTKPLQWITVLGPEEKRLLRKR